ncbi:PA2169 family four-helix-bundle protein [bacterium]|nr:PA2169 family four-helix-bundle protein [bacterium]
MSDSTTEILPSETLNELLTRAYDAEKGYELAAESAENPALKDFFHESCLQRNKFGHTLKGFIADLDVEPDKGSSIEGKIHQAFMKIKAALVDQDDLALVEECRRGEETAMLDYKAALENPNLRTDARAALEKQGADVLHQLDALESIEAALEISS